METVPKDTNVLVFDAGPLVRVVRRREKFTKVEGPLWVESSLLDVPLLSSVNRAGITGALSLVIDDGALRQLAGELIEGSFSSVDVNATRGGQARRGAVDALHAGKEKQGQDDK